MSLPCPYHTLSQWWPSQPLISLYLHGCPPYSLTATHPTCTSILSLFKEKITDQSLDESKRNHFDVISSKCRQDRQHCVGQVSYRYLTATNGMPYVDDFLPFCCKQQRKELTFSTCIVRVTVIGSCVYVCYESTSAKSVLFNLMDILIGLTLKSGDFWPSKTTSFKS